MNDSLLRLVADQFGTPLFIFDGDELRERLEKIRSIIDGACPEKGRKIKLCYSIKANPFLIPYLDEYVDMFEVCSPGELEIVKHLNISPDKIIYSGVNKGSRDISQAIEYGVAIITIESLRHFELLREAVKESNDTVHVILRLTSGNQFGMSLSDIEKILAGNACENISIDGIHYFAGTQRNNPGPQEKELAKIRDIVERLRQEYDLALERIEYGPGLSYPYFVKDDFTDTLLPLRNISDSLAKTAQMSDLTVEMGRFIASSCGYYLTSVCDIKSSNDMNWCILDGGLNHVNYYGQMMGMKCPVIRHMSSSVNSSEVKEVKTYALCGSLCTSNDILVREKEFCNLLVGDVLVFENLGAYSVTEGINLFLSRDMAKIVFIKDGEATLLRDTVSSWKINCNCLD